MLILPKKTDFDGELEHLDKKVTWSKAKHVLAENELKKLQTICTCFLWIKAICNDGAQLYLIFQLLYYTLKKLGNTGKVVSWKSKGF